MPSFQQKPQNDELSLVLRRTQLQHFHRANVYDLFYNLRQGRGKYKKLVFIEMEDRSKKIVEVLQPMDEQYVYPEYEFMYPNQLSHHTYDTKRLKVVHKNVIQLKKKDEKAKKKNVSEKNT